MGREEEGWPGSTKPAKMAVEHQQQSNARSSERRYCTSKAILSYNTICLLWLFGMGKKKQHT
jgi:hypothetical protein